jgi:site-specific DNA-methyltransferase (adenine-specific)
MRDMPDNSIDAVVTDPPYELGFMGKKWDSTGIAYNVELWQEVLRVLKPGGHLLAFGGTRTYHRMACAIEDAGFEIRDCIQWIYGSGFSKSMDISKAIDKKLGAERKVIGQLKRNDRVLPSGQGGYHGRLHEQYQEKGRELIKLDITAPSTDEAKQWEGWGTALKPANEPIVVARKPLSEKTVVDNVLKWGTGGINIDDCRIKHSEPVKTTNRKQRSASWNMDNCGFDSTNNTTASASPLGRFPANVILDEEAGRLLDEQSGIRPAGNGNGNAETGVATNGQGVPPLRRGKLIPRNDTGGASRFFKDCSYDKEEISWLRSQRYAQFVKENLLTMCAIIEITVPESAMQSLNVLKEILVNYAESQLKTIDMDTVLKNVVILQSQEDSQLNNMIIRFMREMLNVLKKKDESSIKQMMNIGKKLEQELKHTTMEKLKCNHVRYVEIQLLISIMTITQNLLNTDGYAESVTSIYMLSNTEVGEKDYQLASRFKYCAKASKKERGDSKHPTVKPLSLMRYLCRLITPPGGIALDPFAGSGTTLEAAILEGFNVVGIEKEHDYIPDIRRRIERAQLNTQALEMDLFLANYPVIPDG